MKKVIKLIGVIISGAKREARAFCVTLCSVSERAQLLIYLLRRPRATEQRTAIIRTDSLVPSLDIARGFGEKHPHKGKSQCLVTRKELYNSAKGLRVPARPAGDRVT